MATEKKCAHCVELQQVLDGVRETLAETREKLRDTEQLAAARAGDALICADARLELQQALEQYLTQPFSRTTREALAHAVKASAEKVAAIADSNRAGQEPEEA